MNRIRAMTGAVALRMAACVLALAIWHGPGAGGALAQLGGDDRFAAIVIDHRTGQVLHATHRALAGMYAMLLLLLHHSCQVKSA